MKQILILLLVTIGFQSFSQDTTKQILELGPIVVIGIRADAKTPVSQQIVTKSDIQKTYQGQEIPVLLDKTTSITSQSDGGQPQGYTYFRIRGIDQSRVNMTLNGVPLNEPEDQGVYTSNYPGFTNAIQSMQIQRGVGTSTNGVASYAGSINFIGQTGSKKETEATLGYGSFNTKRFNFAHSTGLKNGFSMFTNFSAYSSDGYKYHSGGYGFSGFVSGVYYGRNSTVKFTAFTGKAINQMAWLAVSESDIKKDPRTNYNLNDAPDNFKQTLVQLQIVKPAGVFSKVSTTLFYNGLDGKYDYFSSGSKSVSLSSNFYGIISSYQYIRNKVKFNAGVNLNGYNRRHINNEDHSMYLGVTLYRNNGVKNEFSTFTKLSYDISKFTTFVDLQYRYAEFKYDGDVPMNKLNWNFFMPKAGLTYNQSDKLKYYASIGVSKREPTRTNLFGGQDDLTTLSPIKPEQVVDYELGVNYSNRRAFLQSNLYYMNFKNEITLLGALGSNGLPLMTNVTKSFRSGLEVDFDYKNLIQGMSVNTNMNYSFNQITDNKSKFQPLYTPTFVVNQNVTFDLGKIDVNFNAKYQNKSYISFDNKFSTPEFVIFGVNVSYTRKVYSILLQGNNLTGKTYYTSGYVINNERYFFANPRKSLYLTLKVRL